MNDPRFVGVFTQALRPGAYLRILEEGDIGAGDEIRVVEEPATDLTVRDVLRIYIADRQEAARLLGDVRISEAWRNWATGVLRKAGEPPAPPAAPGCC
jgi:MOSC domain-containing protein YiiM